MKVRDALLFAALAGGFASSCVFSVLMMGQAVVQAQTKSDGPFHPPEMVKPEDAAADAKTHKATPAARNRQPLVALTKIEIVPATVSITGRHSTQRLLVEGTFADGHQEELTSRSRIAISDAKVAIVDKDNFAVPQGDGQATLTATLQGHGVSAPLSVKDFAGCSIWSFRNDVLPVMTKMGCNSGACHGAAAGKNGFTLTLRGYDPEADYYSLTHQALARRTETMEPAKSLILLKPTLAIPHGGGKRFTTDSPEYGVIAGWIAQGMPAPRDSDPRITEILVLPREASLRPGAEQQLLVTAIFSDGRTVDVTRWAKYDSGDESVATVGSDGHVTMHGYGEAPVTVWYQSHVTFSRLRIPFPHKLSGTDFSNAPRNNFIDDAILKHLELLHIPPSPPASDAIFIRRAYLDAAGILPTPAEVDRFLKDSSPNKRDQLIDEVMKRPEFVDYWAYKWSDLLLVSSNRLSSGEM